MKIAVIGTGISGLTSAYLLDAEHELTLYEAEDWIGGHTATRSVEVASGRYNIDTGFIVFNDATYPNFIRLLGQLGIGAQATEMSFSVHAADTGLEYNGGTLNGLFAQRRNLVKPDFWKMLADILRFNREALKDLEAGSISAGETLGEYLSAHGYGQAFRNHYLIPMGSAIWSAGLADMLDFPLQFFVRFFKNHGLLQVSNRPQWRVVEGGSASYVTALLKGMRARVLSNTPVHRVTRDDGGVTVESAQGSEVFDQVIFACHSDQALAMLTDASPQETDILGRMPYQDNSVILHTDTRLLPSRRRAWAAWNYHLQGNATNAAQALVTYNMNILQGLSAPETFCVSLNNDDQIDPTAILGRYTYAHPAFSLASVAAAERWPEINGVNRTWYCGAYWANGFHEDGCLSGIRVARGLGAEW